MRSPIWFSRFAIAAVTFTLCGGPQIAAAQQTAPVPAQEQIEAQPAIQTTQQQQPSPAATQDQNIGTTNDSATPDPSRGPLMPQDSELPNAPSATKNSAEQPNAGQDRPAEQPVGAAAAEAAKTSGGAASKPAGAAIAPAKQRQTRSLLIKIGAIAAAGAALGIVYGLSRSSPSTPPGANTTTSASTAQR